MMRVIQNYFIICVVNYIIFRFQDKQSNFLTRPDDTDIHF